VQPLSAGAIYKRGNRLWHVLACLPIEIH